jgi:hypothetical protein
MGAPRHRGPHRPGDRALSAVICVGRFDHPMILARRALSCPARGACGPQLSHLTPSNLAVVAGYSADSTCAHTTIIPTNRVMDAKAVASSTNARIMLLSPRCCEHRGNIVHDMFLVNGALELRWSWLMSARARNNREALRPQRDCESATERLRCTICVCVAFGSAYRPLTGSVVVANRGSLYHPPPKLGVQLGSQLNETAEERDSPREQ